MAPLPQSRFEQLAALFDAAVALPPSEREAFVAAMCGDDPDLRKELDRLLVSDSELQQKPSSAASPLPRFGNYQARELIGAGGMGAVYLATREDGEVRQRVAIKAIASAFVSPLLEDRLRRERQILSELHHPNIASFLDGGITGDGFSYLVMEYVEGEPIDSWCDSRRLPIRSRLDLFLKVCAAVSFAHQRLIVHRDLKPGNILVTGPAGGRPGEPKLLDFGIARTLSADVDATHATTNLFVTPRYASPEVLRNQPATVAADVYSLGVLLYELLSGARPFGRPGATPVELIESVLSSEPLRLTAAVRAEPAAARGETASGLSRRLRGDLQAIVAKAMTKSPADRYASVEQLAGDIRHHQAGRPVEAAAPSPYYRARKFVARHKSAVAAGALVAVSLIAGLVATLWQKRVADRRFADAHELARYLVFDLQKSVGNLPGSTPLKAEMVQRSLHYLDRLSGEKIGDPTLRTEVGEAYAELGIVLGSPFQPNLGQPAKAQETDRKAIAILDPIIARDSNNRRARVVLTRTRLELGRNVSFNGQAGEGLKLIEEAARESARLAQRWPSDFDTRQVAAFAFDSLARALSQSGSFLSSQNFDPAMDALKSAITHADAAAQLRPLDFAAIRQLAMGYKFMGDLTDLRDRRAATPFYRKGLAALDRIAVKDRDTPDARSARSSLLLGLGWNLGNCGDFAPALAALDEARVMRDRMSAEDPQNVMALLFRTTPYRNLGIVSGYAGRKADQLRYFLIAIGIYDQLLAKNSANQGYAFTQAELQAAAANLSVELGKPQEAARLGQAGIATLKRAALRPEAASAEMSITAAALLDTQIPGLGDTKLALVLAKKATDLNPTDTVALDNLAKAYWRNGDRAAAVQSMEKALALIGPEKTPTRTTFEESLEHYRTAKLSQ